MQWSYSDADRVSGANLEGDWNGVPIRGMQSIDLSDEATFDLMYGNDGVSMGAPPGSIKGEFTLVTIPEEADEIIRAMGPNFYRTYSTIGLTVVRAAGPLTINLSRVRLNKQQAKFEAGGQKGSEGTLTAVVLDPIDWNGLQGLTRAGSVLFSFPINLGF